ncbi:hypothetical protein TEA_014075 [Camellia sinensis var. sinensis]|uniref:Uncharacterized protein n=1 Tax=Camellia sinensis var. sinensis TaxID=542762 RepID=A0A4S4DYU3_CAMSN|nr:hypothetical protein TEA_014075 [Camellia sinensis var. sinensis]
MERMDSRGESLPTPTAPNDSSVEAPYAVDHTPFSYPLSCHPLACTPKMCDTGHDTRLVDIIHGGFEGLSMPKGTRLDHLLTDGIDVGLLKEETTCHAPVSNLSGLSLSVTLKWDSDFDDIFQRLKSQKKWSEFSDSSLKTALIWDSDFDDIFQRLKSEKKWSEFSDSSLKTALIEHFSHLHKLNDNLDISVGNMSEGDSILEAITKDYSEELSRLTKGIAETRMKNYVDHLEFKRLVNKCAAQAKALSTEFIAKASKSIDRLPNSQRLCHQLSSAEKKSTLASQEHVQAFHRREELFRASNGQIFESPHVGDPHRIRDEGVQQVWLGSQDVDVGSWWCSLLVAMMLDDVGG